MLASNSPTRIPLPFASSGTKNAIPTASQIGIKPGAASLTDGFPPLTFTPLAAGGVPPNGADFNGILNLLSANTQWANAGGGAKYDAAFSASIGGYPKGAKLMKATNDGYWLSTTDSNTTNPDAGGVGWSDLGAMFGGRPGRVYSLNDWAYLDKASGLIIQWGQSGSTAADGSVVITYPVSFTSASFQVIASSIAGATGVASANVGALPSLSTVTLRLSSAQAEVGIRWFAIGK